jgi:predicted negative regulator of RcsB-dependent stress response
MDFLGSIDIKEALRQKNTKIVIALIGLTAIGFGVYFAFKWHNVKIQQNAQRSFSEAVDTYKEAFLQSFEQSNKDSKAKWDEVELAFSVGHSQNPNSTISPFFLAYESDAQLKLGKIEEAYKTLNEAIEKMPKDSPYYYLYKIKSALIEIDKIDEHKGIVNLNNLVTDKNNTFKDMASFYLGEYYWSKNDINKAKEQYQNALSYNPESPWANLSKSKLQKIK